MDRYDFLEAIRVILAMFEPTPTLSNFDFGQLFMTIGVNNDQIWLARGLKSDFDKCSNNIRTDLNLIFV